MKFCVSNMITATESLKMLQMCFGESTLSRTQVFKWHKAFSESREVVKNLPHVSRLSTSVNDDNIEKVKKIVLETRRVGIREVAEALKISYESTQHIVVDVLGIKRVAARLVPKNLNFLQKELRVEFAKGMLANVAHDPTFIERIITRDEMWVYDSALRETRHESVEAIKKNSLTELKAIPAKAYKKCMENYINRWHACIGSEGAYFEGDYKSLY